MVARSCLVSGFLSLGLLLVISSACLGQETFVGEDNSAYAGNFNPSGVETVFEFSGFASGDGVVTTAVFGWSRSSCSAAAKIKFFRPVVVGGANLLVSLVAERGPFDVTAPVNTSALGPPVTQIVILDPPVPLHAGDMIAITNLTSCGGPTLASDVPNLNPLPSPKSLGIPGDVGTGAILPNGPYGPAVFLAAFGATDSLELLGRFRVSLSATDPRTGRGTAGSPVPLTTSAGYFSLPDFTGDSTFPEVMVKMVDATGAPGLGGDFWFFHAPLTDVSYSITVTDQWTAAVRTTRALRRAPDRSAVVSTRALFVPEPSRKQ